MIAFILSIILVLAALGLGVAALFSKTGEDKLGFAGSAVVALIIGGIILCIGCVKDVPVKNVGVVTSFGKIEGFMRPGLHWAAPWASVTDLPETIQTTTWEGGFAGNGTCEGLDVRIGGQQHGCLDATIQWQILDSAAAGLFNNYDTSPGTSASPACSGNGVLYDICNAVVVREFKVAVNQVMGDYNPIQDVALNSGAGNSQFSTFGPAITAVMKKDIGAQIVVRTVLVPFLHYDSTTQARLDAIQQQFAATAIAQQTIKTNQALAAANAAINTRALTPAALQAECYSIVQDAVKLNYQGLPASLNCQGGNVSLALSTAKK